MAKFWVVETVVFNGVKLFAGAEVDDTTISKPLLEAAGTQLWPKGADANVDAAALKAQASRANKGSSEDDLDDMMKAAVDIAQSAAISGGNTVDPATAVNQTVVAVNQNTTAVNQNTTAVNQNTALAKMETFLAIPMSGVNVHAQFPGGAPLNAVAGFTPGIRYPRRSLQVIVGAGGVPTVYTVTGTSVNGDVIVLLATAAGAGTFPVGNGTPVFETITSITSDVDPVGTTDLTTGDAFGLSSTFSAVEVLAVDGVVEATLNVDSGTGGILATTAPNGVHNYYVRYRQEHTHVQDAHTHTQTAHTHVQTTHNHVQNPHTHTLS